MMFRQKHSVAWRSVDPFQVPVSAPYILTWLMGRGFLAR